MNYSVGIKRGLSCVMDANDFKRHLSIYKFIPCVDRDMLLKHTQTSVVITVIIVIGVLVVIF